VSASLPSEELPRRGGEAQERTLLVRLAAEIAWPMPLTGLVNIPIGPLDNFWQEEPATASGTTDDKQPNR
jgi:hypothetical protein